ncbi:MAG: hypothetical protein ACXWUG_25365 [Polyangiales bacterium]
MRFGIAAILLSMSCVNGGSDDPPFVRTDGGADTTTSEDASTTCDPAADPCTPDKHCSPLLRECIDGCHADEGCGGKKCDVANHECVTCVSNGDCTAGEVCSAGECVPMCSASSPCPGALTCCSAACVDPATNLENCGGCGNPCTIAHGKGACTGGKCNVSTCELPYSDCDKDSKTGCETDTSSNDAHCGGCDHPCASKNGTGKCVSGACTITCNGSFADCDKNPTNGCEADLAHDPSNCGACGNAPAETCNMKDDNCNGKCDDVAGCRVAVHRSVNATEHFYTTDATEAACCGYTVESSPYFYLYSSPAPDTVAFYRCYSGRHFYTTSSTCEVYGASAVESTMGYIGTKETCGSTALYRLTKSSDHLFTTDPTERDAAKSAGWVDEGIAGWVWRTPTG